MLDKSQIENMVWEKFPPSEGEKKCAIERDTMNMLRQNYRNKLYEQYKAEQTEAASQTKTSVLNGSKEDQVCQSSVSENNL